VPSATPSAISGKTLRFNFMSAPRSWVLKGAPMAVGWWTAWAELNSLAVPLKSVIRRGYRTQTRFYAPQTLSSRW
jgi:hypothetical protein